MQESALPWEEAARAIALADALLITTGAGMGVDSGLPDFRGDAGFWRAYPPMQALGISFTDMAQPRWFRQDPELAWGFYGHRLNLYRRTLPHAGFEVLRRWASAKPAGAMVFTSNVDGQFQRAGFMEEALCEVHGSLHHLQCSLPCSPAIWSADACQVEVEEATFRARHPLPHCPRCGAVARPNVLMFNDGSWLPERTTQQEEQLADWLNSLRGAALTIIECGAGTAIPTVRILSEQVARQIHAPLLRINVREAQGPPGTLSFPLRAASALNHLAGLLPL